MSQNEATTTRLPDSPVSIYERFTSLYDLMFRFNGYARSIERYLRDNPLPLAAGARVLDAGCGTGLLTLALLRVLKRPAEITAVDLSGRSLQTARRAVRKHAHDPRHKISFLPVRPSPATRLLEIIFRFKAHPPRAVAENTERFFRVIEHYRFPPHEPIGWTKSLVLAQKQ